MKATNRGFYIFSGLLASLLPLLFVMFYEVAPAFGDANELCPLPKEFRVEMDGGKKDNADPGCRMCESLKANTVNEGKNGSKNANFVIKEDEDHSWAFKTEPGNKTPGEISDCDPSTASAFIDWMPKMKDYHPLKEDKSPLGQKTMKDYSSCFTFMGGSEEAPQAMGVRWTPNNGWKVNKVHFAYHMDSPTQYGECGKIGYNVNPGESTTDGGADGKSQFTFKYAEPSVPLWFVSSAVMTITWDWDYKWSHCWRIKHTTIKYVYGVPIICTGCQTLGPMAVAEDAMGAAGYWTPPKAPIKDTTNWDPSIIFTDIQKGEVAKNRMGGNLYYDEQGADSSLYSEPSETFTLPNKPSVVARSTIRVKDVSNVAHVEINVEGGSNELKTECGKKISEGMGDKNMIIRIVDNAIHCTKATIVDKGENTCVDGEWKDDGFKAIFWYEMPLYQYASYQADKWKDPAGVEKPIIEMAYSPMFVWKKKKTWTSYTDFFGNGDGSTETKSMPYNHANTERAFNPSYIIYEKKIPISKLFASDDDNREDIMPWHYATTSLGDSLGGPAYDKALENKEYGGDFTDMNNAAVIDKFKYKPMNFTKGKGPLKYFLEIKDGSKDDMEYTTGGGLKSEVKQDLNCTETYMKKDEYKQGMLKFNPDADAAKFVQYPSSAGDLSPGGAIDPTQGGQDCLCEKYDANTKQWETNSMFKDTEKFQMFGKVVIEDKIKPNAGLKIVDTVRGTIRRLYKLNDLDRLACYKTVTASADQKWALVDTDKHNYKLVETAKQPRAPFTLNGDNEKLWEFKDVALLTGSSPDSGKIWEGRDYQAYPGELADATQDSLDPYGTAEDTKFEMTHQDMRNDPKKAFNAVFYAHDNIDGQRVIKDGVEVKKDFWYKGLAAIDFDSDNEKDKTFNEDIVSKGYSSWTIIDETIPNYQSNPVFKKMYMNDDYYKYPEIVFNNPNCKWDGTDLPNGKKEISVAYAVTDKAGNKRKFKLHFFVAPLDMSIQTIEKKEKKTGF